jgi:NAD(P)-dependent dehydrogenase (short-subunit alcohol dehydrogenase family)
VDGIVLITGGTGGIGSDVARRIVACGGRVALVARDAAHLAALGDELGAPWYAADACDFTALGAAVARVENEQGPITGLVHAVGSVALRPLHATALDAWRAALELNATSAFIVMRHVLPPMMRRKTGSIVLFSSVAARTGLVNHEAIAAAKGAVEALVRSAAMSYARYGIRINAIAPALTRTGLTRALWENERSLAASTALHPLGRIGEAADVGAAVLYFLGEGSGWTTGQILGVDGGLSAGHAPPAKVIPSGVEG